MNRMPTMDELIDSAKRQLSRMFMSIETGDTRQAGMDGAMALEHLAKAALFRRSPSLILEIRGEQDAKALMHSLGVLPGMPPRFRTVSLPDALARLTALGLKFPSSDKIGDLQDLRSGTVHIAADSTLSDDAVALVVGIANTIRDDLELSKEDFWGLHLAGAEACTLQSLSRLEAQVQHKVSMAKKRFQDRYEEMEPGQLEAILMALPRVDEASGEVVAQCPACEGMGISQGHFEEIYSFDDEGAYPDVVLEPESFGCALCQLKLWSREELDLVGLGEAVEVDDELAMQHLRAEAQYEEDRYNDYMFEYRMSQGD